MFKHSFFQLFTHKIFTCHTISEIAEAHTTSAKPDTNSQPLTRFVISQNNLCKTQHNSTHTNLTLINFMEKVFANAFEMCL